MNTWLSGHFNNDAQVSTVDVVKVVSVDVVTVDVVVWVEVVVVSVDVIDDVVPVVVEDVVLDMDVVRWGVHQFLRDFLTSCTKPVTDY